MMLLVSMLPTLRSTTVDCILSSITHQTLPQPISLLESPILDSTLSNPAYQNDSNMEYPNGFELTIGIELEFLVARVLPEGFERQAHEAKLSSGEEWNGGRGLSNYNNDFIRRLIVDRLRSVGVPTNDYVRFAAANFSKWTVIGDGSVFPTDQELKATTQTFANGEVMEITDDARKRLKYTDVEVKSRILPFNEVSLREVALTVDTIKSEFPSYVNSSCGFHIHVGNRAWGFSLNTLKNLGVLVSIALHQINMIHPDHRIQDEYCRSVLYLFKPRDREPMRMARLIENIQTLDEFLVFFHVERPHRDRSDPSFMFYREMAYNFLGLDEEGKIPTIEFRQHQGTLDSEAIQRWTLMAASTVGLCHDPTNLYTKFLPLVGHPNYDIINLLRDLYLDFLAKAYKGKIYHHSRERILEFWDPSAQSDSSSGGGS